MFSSLHQALETVTLALDLLPTGGTPTTAAAATSSGSSDSSGSGSSPGSSAFEVTSPVDRSKQLVARARASFERCYRCTHLRAGDSAGEGQGGGSFEWVDGVVVTALKTGAWLLIDNVNLCSPSVLDRLNSLLEPNGSLLVTER